MEVSPHKIVHDAGHEYVARAEEFLYQAIGGKEYDVKDLSEFALVAGSTLFGNMFSILYAESKEDAETWLKKALGLIGSAVRIRGSSAMLKVSASVKDVPNKMFKAEPAQESAQELKKDLDKAMPCVCELGADKKCRKCLHNMTKSFKSFFSAFQKMSETTKIMSECKACQAKLLDEALSLSVPEIMAIRAPGSDDAAFAQELMVAIQQIALVGGVQEMPLTENAWKEATEGK